MLSILKALLKNTNPSIVKIIAAMKRIFRRVFLSVPCYIFSHMKINNYKIVFENYMGRGFGCNPKPIAQELINRKCSNNYDLVWLVSKEDIDRADLPTDIRIVRYGSLRSLYELFTARVWVSNYHKIYFVYRGLKKRNEQYFIQTWHGSLGIKKIEADVNSLVIDKYWCKSAITSSEMTDYWISNSTFETDVFKRSFWNVNDNDILPYGHPRNDLFFNKVNLLQARDKIVSKYRLEGKKILLYAPTFREDYRTDCYRIDFARLICHLSNKFGGEWIVLVRLHPRLKNIVCDVIATFTNICDVSGYADMQELLAASDCLITDYSSCAFDFMLTQRPVFLYIPDMIEYTSERGFYYPIQCTPFPIAYNNDDLMINIDTFDSSKYKEMLAIFLNLRGCFEDGHSSERVANLIDDLIEH